MKTGFIKALAFTVGTSLVFSPFMMACSTINPTPAPAPVTPSVQTVGAMINLLKAFGVIQVPLTTEQVNELVAYLDGTQKPDVTHIIAMLQSFGVMSKALNADQITAIVALLSSMGYLPMISGHPATAGTSIK